jgi:outer membrane protein OmpA-like peptidoglycan-associated protein/uncharacterized protein YidB (DUF937 family)
MNLEALVKLAIQQFGGGSAGMVSGLLQGLLRQFLDDKSGGLAGFLDLFRNAGLGEIVNGWIGGSSTGALKEDQLKAALGGGGGLLEKLGGMPGMSSASLLPMLGLLIPKLIGALTPGGQMPSKAGLMQQMETLANLPVLKMPAVPNLPAMPEKSGGGWLLPVLAGLALIGAVLMFSGIMGSKAPEVAEVKEAATATATDAVASVREAIPGLGAFLKRKLASGVELDVPENGIESHVVAFIEDAAKLVDKTTWFDFDRLLFDTGKATLQASSEEQLKNVAAIMAAYPKVKIKIGGYTDNTGNKEANMKLSGERAANVMAELVKLGVAADRMASEGYGDQFPVGDNATEEGRAKNRRISLRVTEK